MSATVGNGSPDHPLSANMQRVYDDGVRAASSGASILILGEEGVGKEVLATWLHAFSPRARKPLLPINCAALPESSIGEKLERVDGAILLDEIGEIEIDPLRKLRAALDPAEVQIFAITSRNLQAEIAAGQRSPEYMELTEVTLLVPPLRERRSEIRALAQHFLARQRAQDGRPPLDISEEAMTRLESYSWPGNVRELSLQMYRAAILCEGTAIGLEHLADRVAGR